VVQAIAEWQRKVEAARHEGRGLGLQEAQTRIQAAEARAAKAEQDAKASIAKAAADAETKLGGAIAAFTKASAAIEGLHRQLLLEAEGDSVRLACALAARILARAVDEDPGWMVPVLTRALAQVPDRRAVAVRMHPADAAAARERLAIIIASTPGLEGLALTDDPTLSRGACLVSSQGTRLDASLPASFDRVSALLAAEIPVPPLAEAKA
jgi:type III secretion protein L